MRTGLYSAAAKLGLTVAQYSERKASGMCWCWTHGAWHPAAEFGQDKSRRDGIARRCKQASRDLQWMRVQKRKGRA